MDTTKTKGKPRGRNGGRRLGSKDKTPRTSKDLNEKIFLRVNKALMRRIEQRASLQGETIPDFVRGILDEHV